jgi:hypothetical protein
VVTDHSFLLGGPDSGPTFGVTSLIGDRFAKACSSNQGCMKKFFFGHNLEKKLEDIPLLPSLKNLVPQKHGG